MMTQLETLRPLSALTPMGETKQQTVQETTSTGESVFGAIFRNAIQNVKDTDAEFTQAQYLLATGQLDNPATALIAYSKEEVAVNLLIQLRNRAMDAYSELTRLNI